MISQVVVATVESKVIPQTIVTTVESKIIPQSLTQYFYFLGIDKLKFEKKLFF